MIYYFIAGKTKTEIKQGVRYWYSHLGIGQGLDYFYDLL